MFQDVIKLERYLFQILSVHDDSLQSTVWKIFPSYFGLCCQCKPTKYEIECKKEILMHINTSQKEQSCLMDSPVLNFFQMPRKTRAQPTKPYFLRPPSRWMTLTFMRSSSKKSTEKKTHDLQRKSKLCTRKLSCKT